MLEVSCERSENRKEKIEKRKNTFLKGYKLRLNLITLAK
jgi:hypothetical protein